MKDKIYSALSGHSLVNLLKAFAKGCISENIEDKAEVKPLPKTNSGPIAAFKDVNNKNR